MCSSVGTPPPDTPHSILFVGHLGKKRTAGTVKKCFLADAVQGEKTNGTFDIPTQYSESSMVAISMLERTHVQFLSCYDGL